MQRLLDYEQKCYLYEITKDHRSVIGCLVLLDVKTTKVFEHENAEMEKVQEYMKDFNTTYTQRTPITLAIKNKEPHSLLKTLMLHIKSMSEPLLVNENNGQVNSVWSIDESLQSVVLQLLQQQQLYVIDGHHRYNAIKMNASLGGHKKMLAWVVMSDDCCFKPVHRVVTVPNEIHKIDFIKALGIEPMLNEQQCNPLSLQPGSIGFFDGETWYLIPEFCANTVESLYLIDKTVKNFKEVALRYEVTPKSIQQAIEERSLVFMMPALTFDEIEALCNAKKILPTFSTYIQYRACENILAYRYNVSKVTQKHQWQLDKVS